MLKLKKEEVYVMHLADVLHQLELACHIGKIKMEKYRKPLCEMLLEIIEEGRKSV